MIFDKEGNTTIISQENTSLETLIEQVKEAYPNIKQDHIVLNLFSLGKLSTAQLLEFLDISNKHRASKKSFVLVSDQVSYEEIPDELCVVPTLQEAHDIIEMEEIERDLGI